MPIIMPVTSPIESTVPPVSESVTPLDPKRVITSFTSIVPVVAMPRVPDIENGMYRLVLALNRVSPTS